MAYGLALGSLRVQTGFDLPLRGSCEERINRRSRPLEGVRQQVAVGLVDLLDARPQEARELEQRHSRADRERGEGAAQAVGAPMFQPAARTAGLPKAAQGEGGYPLAEGEGGLGLPVQPAERRADAQAPPCWSFRNSSPTGIRSHLALAGRGTGI